MKLRQILISSLMLIFLYSCAESKTEQPILEQKNDSPQVETKVEKIVSEKVVYENVWVTDYAAAKAEAKKTGKTLFLDFTGSDWCVWCHRLTDDVFSKKEFKEYAKENLILVMLDFPKKTKISEELKMQNNNLAKKFGIRGFPTIILLDGDENKLGQTGYQDGGPVKYVEHLKAMIVPK